jgi:hypothetical protein
MNAVETGFAGLPEHLESSNLPGPATTGESRKIALRCGGYFSVRFEGVRWMTFGADERLLLATIADAMHLYEQPRREESGAEPEIPCEKGNSETLHAACLDCGRDYGDFGMDVLLPRWQWLLIHPDENGLLCAQCIVTRASKLEGAVGLEAVIGICPRKEHP